MVISRTRASVVLLHNGKLLTFRAIDPTSGKEYLFLPGGKVEPTETAPEAAERETFEETGFRVRVDEFSAIDREYFFDWNGQTFDCLTIFYSATLASPFGSPVKDADYNQGVHWVEVDKISESFAYSTEIRSAILELMEKL